MILPTITFAKLDTQSSTRGATSSEGSALETWYEQVRTIPIFKLGDEDLAKACRQLIHLAFVVPTIVERLIDNPVTGTLYDGELVIALASVPRSFWEKNPACVEHANSGLRFDTNFDDDINAAYTSIRNALASTLGQC